MKIVCNDNTNKHTKCRARGIKVTTNNQNWEKQENVRENQEEDRIDALQRPKESNDEILNLVKKPSATQQNILSFIPQSLQLIHY